MRRLQKEMNSLTEARPNSVEGQADIPIFISHMKKIIFQAILLLFLAVSASSQTKQTTVDQTAVFAPAESRKKEISDVNMEFRSKMSVVLTSAKDPAGRQVMINELRAVRDNSLLGLLGAEQFRQYRERASPDYNYKPLKVPLGEALPSSGEAKPLSREGILSELLKHEDDKIENAELDKGPGK